MTGNNYLFDEDLALYAMRLLSEPEAADVSRHLAENPEASARLAEIQMELGIFAEASVTLEPVPDGSLERLMTRISEESGNIVAPRQTSSVATGELIAEIRPPSLLLAEARPLRKAATALPWIGWAIAAGLAVAAGTLYQDRGEARTQLIAENRRAESLGSRSLAISEDKQNLAAASAELGNQISSLKAEMATERARSQALEAKLANGATQTQEQDAALQQQTQRAVAAEGTRDRLNATLDAQRSQMQTLTQQVLSAREVVEALSDRNALRVTLTQPKQQETPTGRATYVASRGTLIFLGSHLGKIEANKVYELWILPADGSSPIPAGTFKPDAQGSATLVAERLPNAAPGKGFAITVEDEGGATTPTMPILLVGTAGG